MKKGYNSEIRRPDDWCSYLEWQESHVIIQGKVVVCKFNNEYTIPFFKCTDTTDALMEAFKLGVYLVENEPAAYPSIVVKQFLVLIRKPQGLTYELPKMFEELWKVFDIRIRTMPEREPPDE